MLHDIAVKHDCGKFRNALIKEYFSTPRKPNAACPDTRLSVNIQHELLHIYLNDQRSSVGAAKCRYLVATSCESAA